MPCTGSVVKRAVTPKAVKRARRALHPVDNAKHSVQRSVATTIRSGRKRTARVWHHGSCPVTIGALGLQPGAGIASGGRLG